MTYEGKSHDLELKNGATVEQAIKEIKVNPQIVLAKRGDEVIPDSEKLNDKDEIALIRIVSGG